MNDDRTPTAVVVGAGFAGIGAARELAKHGVRVVLVERHDYHQFQPLLYQVATAGLARSDVGQLAAYLDAAHTNWSTSRRPTWRRWTRPRAP